MYYGKSRHRKKWLEKCLKSRVSQDPQTNNMANGSKIFCNLNGSTFEIFINDFERQLHWKKSLLVIHKFLILFVKTLTVDDKHYLLKRDNLAQPIKIELSQKPKIFSDFFLAFLKSILNFKHQSKKMTQIADVFPDIPPPKNMVR